MYYNGDAVLQIKFFCSCVWLKYDRYTSQKEFSVLKKKGYVRPGTRGYIAAVEREL